MPTEPTAAEPHPLLAALRNPQELQTMPAETLEALGGEIRHALADLLKVRSAHFASNLGVVELCLALYSVFDFRRDRLIWDTGHQIYPQKLITGRYNKFSTIRTRGGLMGYPNPAESEYDLFMTGHAGCSVSTALGLKSGDDLMGRTDATSIAVIGDGAFPSGIVFEAMNNAAELRRPFIVILNDNKMSICPRVGGVASYLDRLRTHTLYSNLKTEVAKVLGRVPLLGDPTERLLAQVKEAVKAGVCGGMLFEELGFRYIGPIDGHNIKLLKKYLNMVKEQPGPVLLHVITTKGQGFEFAAQDPVKFHTPPIFKEEGGIPILNAGSGTAYTDIASKAIEQAMGRDDRVTVMTAAMCQGNKLEDVREKFPTRFFDVGICESHAVAFAAGQAKAGLRPIVDIYSTFLQRSYDQIFQEVCLQNLPVTFMMDRAGLTGPDGPTHHGVFDLGYLRIFPNITVCAPGDAADLTAMVDFALAHDGPVSIRYPKDTAITINRPSDPIRVGRAEMLFHGTDGTIVACGTVLDECVKAREILAAEDLDIGVVNARFVKPLDKETMSAVLRDSNFVVTVEEGQLMGGFGSALLEFANEERLPTEHVLRLGLPDRFVEHGERRELLADSDLTAERIAARCRALAASSTRRVGQ